MNLLDYLSLLARRGWILLLLVLLGAGGAYLLTRGQTPIYRSTQVILVQPARADLGLSQANSALLNSYVVYLNSNFVAQEIINEYRHVLGDIAPEQLKGITRIGADPTRQIIQIEVDTTDGDVANTIAHAWGQKLVAYRQQLNADLQPEYHINTITQDFPRYSLYRPRLEINAMLGGLLGLSIAAVIVFVLEYRKNSVVQHRDDLPQFDVLAIIPQDT
jgi:capsular polysaccharide biosynthesis protein